VTIDPADRALWDRYVRLRRGAPEGAGEAGTVGIDDAATIAAYIELRLDEWERAAFERRLVDEPILLETLIAARSALGAPQETPVPQAVTAFALNLAPAPKTVRGPSAAVRPNATRERAAQPAKPGRVGWLGGWSALGWAVGTAAFLGAFAIGALVAWEVIEPPQMAQKGKSQDEISPRTNSIFDDPARTGADGVKIDD
jgi:hypothetical protein